MSFVGSLIKFVEKGIAGRFSDMYSFEKLKKYIDNVDVVSFDIFDTLVLRTANQPIYNLIDEDGITEIEEFSYKRVQAQKIAAQNNVFDLPGIYKALSSTYDIPFEICERYMDKEIEAECKHSCLNYTVLDLMVYAKNNNKNIILTSDMHYNTLQIKFILERLGCNLFEHIFVSSDMGFTKSSGKMFRQITKKYYHGKTLLHIGDSLIGDYLMPVLTPKCKAVLIPRKRILSDDDKFLYSVSWLNSSEYLFGYYKLGPVVWYFTKWINDISKREGINNLLFLTREGAFFKNVFDVNSNINTDSSVFYSSRRSLLLYSCDLNWKHFVKVMLGIKCTLTQIGSMFEIKDSVIDNVAEKFGIKTNLPLITYSCAEQVLECIRVQCEQYSKKHRQVLVEYINQICQCDILTEKKKIAVVDIGWSGTSQVMLQNIFSDLNARVELVGLYFAVLNEKEKNCRKFGYICSPENDKFANKIANAGFLLENIFSSQIEQTVAYKKSESGGVVPVFLEKSTEVSSYTLDVQKGILDFAHKMEAEKWVLDKEKYIDNFLEILSTPSKKLAEHLGDIKWNDQDETYFIAKPAKLSDYLFKKRNFFKELNKSGWKSAFCLRFFKLPVNYYKIYNFYKSIRK